VAFNAITAWQKDGANYKNKSGNIRPIPEEIMHRSLDKEELIPSYLHLNTEFDQTQVL
jgi:hypothetical protein